MKFYDLVARKRISIIYYYCVAPDFRGSHADLTRILKLMNIFNKVKNFIFMSKTRKNFTIYTTVGAFVSLANIIFVWLLIDIFHVPTLISTSAVVGFLFFLKFAIYRKTGFTE